MEKIQFFVSRDGGVMARYEGKVAFPERRGAQPQAGETWEVEKAGENASGRVVFLRCVRKIEDDDMSLNIIKYVDDVLCVVNDQDYGDYSDYSRIWGRKYSWMNLLEALRYTQFVRQETDVAELQIALRRDLPQQAAHYDRVQAILDDGGRIESITLPKREIWIAINADGDVRLFASDQESPSWYVVGAMHPTMPVFWLAVAAGVSLIKIPWADQGCTWASYRDTYAPQANMLALQAVIRHKSPLMADKLDSRPDESACWPVRTFSDDGYDLIVDGIEFCVSDIPGKVIVKSSTHHRWSKGGYNVFSLAINPDCVVEYRPFRKEARS